MMKAGLTYRLGAFGLGAKVWARLLNPEGAAFPMVELPLILSHSRESGVHLLP